LHDCEEKMGKMVMITETKKKLGHRGRNYHAEDEYWLKHPHLKAIATKKKFNTKNVGGKIKSGIKCWKCGGDQMKIDFPLNVLATSVCASILLFANGYFLDFFSGTPAS